MTYYMEGGEHMISVTLWGGYSYAAGEPETFESWDAARLEYLSRMETSNRYYPLWGECELDDYVIVDEFDGLTLGDVLRDHDECDSADSCGVLHS